MFHASHYSILTSDEAIFCAFFFLDMVAYAMLKTKSKQLRKNSSNHRLARLLSYMYRPFCFVLLFSNPPNYVRGK